MVFMLKISITVIYFNCNRKGGNATDNTGIQIWPPESSVSELSGHQKSNPVVARYTAFHFAVEYR
jgi:hypothetical protein